MTDIDILAELRDALSGGFWPLDEDYTRLAADEIERLRKALETERRHCAAMTAGHEDGAKIVETDNG